MCVEQLECQVPAAPPRPGARSPRVPVRGCGAGLARFPVAAQRRHEVTGMATAPVLPGRTTDIAGLVEGRAGYRTGSGRAAGRYRPSSRELVI